MDKETNEITIANIEDLTKQEQKLIREGKQVGKVLKRQIPRL